MSNSQLAGLSAQVDTDFLPVLPISCFTNVIGLQAVLAQVHGTLPHRTHPIIARELVNPRPDLIRQVEALAAAANRLATKAERFPFPTNGFRGDLQAPAASGQDRVGYFGQLSSQHS